jgi:hypothetical protein
VGAPPKYPGFVIALEPQALPDVQMTETRFEGSER